ncbi:MAG: 1-deoxy-D-xylulose-5-phosphate reductoisomerase [Dehalococcoidales bacterium]|nr:1-deoxy-D-xylulose-5-phosphate reductoisomerase [Dehalococcoidales bacterium]
MYAPIKIRLAILGSTGSIGRQTLQIVRSLPDRFTVVALAAGQNLDLLAKQVEEFQPQLVYYQTESTTKKLECPAQFMPMEGMASYPNVDTVVVATSGIAGLFATIAAVKSGKNVAIANKEPLVMAGEIITNEAEMSDASILPIDSEHSAIWQCMIGEPRRAKYIILTASGGPFRNYTAKQLQKITPQQALQHPSWQMGKKVTIDSATLMNKGLEVIEAHWLFGIPIEDIRVVIHPQSIIHSMLEFYDGSVKAQMAYPDMRLPIQYALLQPDRIPNPDLPRIDWEKLKELTFEPPDYENFPCLKLAIDAGKAGGTCPSVLCAADEVAVDLFLKGKIAFTDIASLVAETLEQHEPLMEPSIEDILAVDDWARDYTLELARKKR